MVMIMMMVECKSDGVKLVLQKVLERYFSEEGKGIEAVVPKQLELQNKLREGPPKDLDFYSPTTNS